MNRPVRCPAGTLYDAAVHAECPCPSCWADRSFAKLATTHSEIAEKKAESKAKIAPPLEPKGRRTPSDSKKAAFEQKINKVLSFVAGKKRTHGIRSIAAFFFRIRNIWARVSQLGSREIASPIGSLTVRQGATALIVVIALTAGGIYLVYRGATEKNTLSSTAAVSANEEEQTYRAARGELSRLRSYVKNCKVCAFSSAASEEIGYLSARGDLDQLRTYVKTCQSCEFAAAAREEIRDREYKASIFTFEVCNRTSHQAGVAAVARKGADSNDWTIKGWGVVDAGLCKPLGTFARDKFYAVATVNSERKGWYGKDAKHCVEIPGPFERDVSADATCPANGRIVGFREFKIADDHYTWSLNEEPSFSDDDFFALEVCNQTSYQAAVAIAARPVPTGDWTLEGWHQVNAGSCGAFGKFAKGKIYAMAKVHNESQGWYGADTKQCVEIPGPFKRIVSAKYPCPPNGKVVGFRAFDVTGDKYTWAINGAPALSDDDFFTFEVCNKSVKRASVAVMGRADPESPFVVQGWHTVTANSCETIGRFARGTFYAMASQWGDVSRGWWQKDIHLCVELPGPFNRVNSESYKCQKNERLVPFRKFSITSSKFSWSLN